MVEEKRECQNLKISSFDWKTLLVVGNSTLKNSSYSQSKL